MAPVDPKLSSSPVSKHKGKAPVSDDDVDQWDDLTESPDTEEYPKIPMKSPPSSHSPAQDVPCGWAQLPGQLPLQFADPLQRTLPTAQQKLEARIVHLAEIDLGLQNALHVLECHLVDGPNEEANRTMEILPGSLRGGPTYGPYSIRHNYFSTERTYTVSALKDMAYLIGLKKSLKLLKDAIADPNREDLKYKIKIIQPVALPQPPPPPPMMGPPSYPPQPMMPPMSPMSMTTMQEQLRVIAKDIVKDTVKECKNEGGSGSTDSVQQEMIKLLRDVCRDALQKKE